MQCVHDAAVELMKSVLARLLRYTCQKAANMRQFSVQECEGNILDDEVLINTLNNSKLTAGQ